MCTAQFELTFLDGHLLQELVPSRSGYVGNFDHILNRVVGNYTNWEVAEKYTHPQVILG